MNWSKYVKFRTVVGFCVTASLLGFGFQNCSKVEFSGEEFASRAMRANGGFAEFKAGDDTNLPPLKLFFIVDNSGTMQANQISLSSAFSKMFEGTNATSLAAFDTTAYVINTGQMTLPDTSAHYQKLPSKDLSFFEQSSMAQLQQGPRAQIVNGQIPGDLVGYRTYSSKTVDGFDTVKYEPAPVAGFESSGARTIASVGVYKSSTGDLSKFTNEFKDRVSILDPARSAMDPVTKTGVMDVVIDKESGLCAAARVLKYNDRFLNPGDMAAIIIVSDEEDSDPKGVNCIDAYTQYSGQPLIDGHCVQPKTELSYLVNDANAVKANCNVKYDSGVKVNYTYQLDQTDLKWYTIVHDRTVRQTQVKYYSGTSTYTQPRVKMSYFKKSFSYKLPQTTISYSTKTESCDIRDGVKFNCQYTYNNQTTKAYDAVYTGNCAAYSNGKLPSNAVLNEPSHPISCNSLPALVKTASSCPTSGSAYDCSAVYSGSRTDLVANGSLGSSSCEAFAAGKLPSDAVISDAGYAVLCADASLNGVVKTGLCAGEQNCVNNIQQITAASVDGVPAGSTAAQCETFAKSKVSMNNPIYGQTTYPITCTESAGRNEINVAGACNPNNTLIKNCVERTSTNASTSTVPGVVVNGQSCIDFIKQNVTSGNPISDSGASCTLSANKLNKSGSKSLNYSLAVFQNYTPSVGSSCSNDLKNYISDVDQISALQSCTISSLNSATHVYNQAKTCEEIANPASICDGVSKRNCLATSVQPGNPYKTETITRNEGFTCETECSQTSLCLGKSGKVSDNYLQCQTTAVAPGKRSFSAQLASKEGSICKAPEELTAVVTKRYNAPNGSKPEYVAGDLSEQAQPNALASYIKNQSEQVFGENIPAVSVFVRQPGDTLGTNGSIGVAYNHFAGLMNGQKGSVLSTADSYASSLQSLGGLIKQRLSRSLNVPIGVDQTIRQVWFRRAGESQWGAPMDEAWWSAKGGTVSISPDFQFDMGDEFRVEYY